MGIGCLGCTQYLLVRGIRFAVADILHYGSRKEIHVLLYNADMISETLELDLSDIHAVQTYASAAYIIESGNETAQGCFSCT